LPDRHVERSQDQLRSHVLGNRPTHDLAAEGIQDHGKEQETRRGRDIGDVGDPEPVRGIRREPDARARRYSERRALAAIGLGAFDPVSNGLGRGFQLLRQFFRTAAGVGQLKQLLLE
jgi:hypothetical protein